MKLSITTRSALEPSGEVLTWDSELLNRFWAKIQMGSLEECWFCNAEDNGLGYQKFSIGHHQRPYAHRITYEFLVGTIPEGLELDHLCRNPDCVNPVHLEPVTHQINTKRGDHYTNNASRLKTHCQHGHEFTVENTYIIPSTGSRHCRTCRKIWHKNAYAKSKIKS